jgi:starch phosphorylase
MIRIYLSNHDSLEGFHNKYAAQLNDTHPSIAVAELMRLLVDEYQMEWDKAWHITTQTFCYTNHTLLPEALERWSVDLMGSLLPRLLEIIYEINHRFLDTVRRRYPGDNDRIARMSLIDESGAKYVRMAHLACVGSRAVNGVARLHTDLLKASVLKDFYELTPDKFSNKTNGVTPRRFILDSNPDLAKLITEKIGSKWVCDLERLRELEAFVDDREFQERWKQIKLMRKQDLARIIKNRSGVQVAPESMFDIQVKRIHEYKRQHLNVLHVISLYHRIKRDPRAGIAPRTVIFGGKAAPGYALAKLIIKFIHGVADVVNRDPDVNQWLRVAFIPDFNVKNAQPIYPAADLSEQISTAGKEASGTGNMKFALNGALTIGTLDGANIEIRQAVGTDNFFAFGLQSDEVARLKAQGYAPHSFYQANAHLRHTIDLIQSGTFSHGDRGLFNPLIQSLLSSDPYMVMADFEAYVECQTKVDELFLQPDKWVRKSILNVARMGFFSSDRAIRQYCEDIWHVDPLPIDLNTIDQTTLRFDALDDTT